MTRTALPLLALLCSATPLAAQGLSLGLPLDCTLGQTCYVQQYVDRDAGPDHSDFACGKLSYDGHKGTDFALPSLGAMQTGVDVLAAAGGIVTGIRNDMPDIMQGAPNAPDIAGKECGNGVVVAHDNGWETQYCHLKKGSVTVTQGDHISQGAVLGKVGLSGETQFPHVHLSVRKDGNVIDPYDADEVLTCNDPDLLSLWQTDMAYVGTGIINLGFSNSMPKYAAIKAGGAHNAAMPTDTPALVFWGYAYGGQKGDILELLINGPKGEVIRHQANLEKPQAQFFRAAGKRTKSAGWPIGTYTGTATLLRGGDVLALRKISVQIE